MTLFRRGEIIVDSICIFNLSLTFGRVNVWGYLYLENYWLVNARMSVKEHGDIVGEKCRFITEQEPGTPDHAPLFTSYTVLGERTFPDGKSAGRIKDAEEEAARSAMNALKGMECSEKRAVLGVTEQKTNLHIFKVSRSTYCTTRSWHWKALPLSACGKSLENQ